MEGKASLLEEKLSFRRKVREKGKPTKADYKVKRREHTVRRDP